MKKTQPNTSLSRGEFVSYGIGYVPDPSLLKKMRDAISKKYFPFNPYLATVSFIYPHLNSFETLVFQCNSYLYRGTYTLYVHKEFKCMLKELFKCPLKNVKDLETIFGTDFQSIMHTCLQEIQKVSR